LTNLPRGFPGPCCTRELARPCPGIPRSAIWVGTHVLQCIQGAAPEGYPSHTRPSLVMWFSGLPTAKNLRRHTYRLFIHSHTIFIKAKLVCKIQDSSAFANNHNIEIVRTTDLGCFGHRGLTLVYRYGSSILEGTSS
jgi:hypothetical protein